MCVGTYCTVVSHFAVGNAAGPYLCIFAYIGIVDITETFHYAPVVKHSVSLDYGKGLNNDVFAYFYGWFYVILHLSPLLVKIYAT